MKKIVHHLRQKPEEERRHILHISIVIAGIVMIILWTFSLGQSLSAPETKIKTKKDLQPFSLLKDDLVNTTKESFR